MNMLCFWGLCGLLMFLGVVFVAAGFLLQGVDDDALVAMRRMKFYVHRLNRHANRLEREVKRMRGAVCVSRTFLLDEGIDMSADLSQEIAAITAATDVIDSAVVLIRSIPELIETAVAAAVDNGATAEQLQPLADLADTLNARAAELAQAVVDNTPAAG